MPCRHTHALYELSLVHSPAFSAADNNASEDRHTHTHTFTHSLTHSLSRTHRWSPDGTRVSLSRVDCHFHASTTTCHRNRQYYCSRCCSRGRSQEECVGSTNCTSSGRSHRESHWMLSLPKHPRLELDGAAAAAAVQTADTGQAVLRGPVFA